MKKYICFGIILGILQWHKFPDLRKYDVSEAGVMLPAVPRKNLFLKIKVKSTSVILVKYMVQYYSSS
ncbi:hypothetical protein [Cloacibacterium normanense]